MRVTLLRIVDRSVTDETRTSSGFAALQDALLRLHHDVEIVVMTSSLQRCVNKLEAAMPDVVWPMAIQPSVSRERGRFALALLDELGLPSIGTSSLATNRALDDDSRRALLVQAGLAGTTEDLPNGSVRVFVAWMAGIAGSRLPNEPLGSVTYSSASSTSFEPFVCAPEVAVRVAAAVDAAAAALGLAGWALFELFVDKMGQTEIVSVDPLASWDESSPMLASLSARGVSLEAVVSRIMATAQIRLHSADKPWSRSGPAPIRVGLIFNIKRIKPAYGGKNDEEAEFDSPTTIVAITEAIRSFGHEVVPLEATPELPSMIRPGFIDVVFNIAEGLRGRSRESQVPALLDLCEIPYTGSDPTTMVLTLDKGLAKRIVRQAGVPTPNWFVLRSGEDKIAHDLRYPVVVKPIAEGSSKGVLAKSVAENETQLRDAANALGERYSDGVIVEEFLPGREFTVALLGEHEIRVLPPMEIVFRADLHHPIYTFDHKLNYNDEVHYEVPANVDAALLQQIEKVAKGAFIALGCRDIARIDVRLDARGVVNFIECNPLPGLTPKWSDLCMMTQAIGMDYTTLIGEILAPALRRFRFKQAPRLQLQKGKTQQ